MNLDTGEPLTDEITKYELYGQLGSGPFWNKRKNQIIIYDQKIKRAISKEIEAQMKRYIELGFTSMHIDSHHHRHCIPSILSIVIPLAKKYGFRTMRISRNIGPDLNWQKVLLKKYVNSQIKKVFDTTKWFGSYNDWCFAGKPKNAEIMVHIKKVDGMCTDVTNKRIQLPENFIEI